MNIQEKLKIIQSKLKAPKNQYNNFGKYNYRSLEDITEAVKPLLNEVGATITMSDKIILVGERYYVESTAILTDIENNESIQVTSQARESQDKKGMDSSQITGATSSYARKYALNGLFAIDDTKDTDSHEYQSKEQEQKSKSTVEKITQTQVDELKQLADIKKIRITDIENKKGKKIEEFIPVEYAKLMTWLREL